MLHYGELHGDTQVVVDELSCHVLVLKRMGAQWITTLDYQARNLRVLAEHLSDAVGYGPAVELLYEWDLDHRHPLWTLNHKGGTNHFTDC